MIDLALETALSERVGITGRPRTGQSRIRPAGRGDRPMPGIEVAQRCCDGARDSLFAQWRLPAGDQIT